MTASNVLACTYPDEQTTQCIASWVEPTENTDNSPLTDLAFVRVMCSLDNITFNQCGADTQATSPTGGGQASVPINIPVAIGEKKTVYVYGLAYNSSGISSEKGNIAQKEINRLAPKPTTDFMMN